MSAVSPSLTVGLATYSLRHASVESAIGLLHRCGIKSVAVFNAHVPIRTGTPEQCRAAAQKFRDAGIALASTGVAELCGDPALMRPLFENARAAGVPAMACTFVTAPDRATLRVAGDFAREYEIKLAIHNHGPEDPVFPGPREIWQVIRECDARIGLCLDVGHAHRAGADVVGAITEFAPRLYDVHLNDTCSTPGMHHNEAVGLGFGQLDLPAIMGALRKINYSHQVGLEDEVPAPDPFPGIANSLGYVRGLLAGLERAAAGKSNS